MQNQLDAIRLALKWKKILTLNCLFWDNIEKITMSCIQLKTCKQKI